jgi:hypothetical protein
MNVFVLTTGRSGSSTFAAACRHITNYTTGHESRYRNWSNRFDYPDRHIEIDPRFAWWLGTLDRHYGNDPIYVWLRRHHDQVAASTAKRNGSPRAAITHWPAVAYYNPQGLPAFLAAAQMVESIEDNIALFLKDKTRVHTIHIEDPTSDFVAFWDDIDAQGDLMAAAATLKQRHNTS